MKSIATFVLTCLAHATTAQGLSATVTLTKNQLLDKIKGGWAGQVIGVTYGGPTEFRFNGTMVNQYVPIPWHDGYIKKTMTENAGLYDDLYMDLTFVQVFEQYGLGAAAEKHAEAYARAGYMLWHANQAGRYNILNGIPSSKSGHWLNNPHADDLDFQIESDFAGLMSPGMPNTAARIGDPIGHIMNYGDGWYGGVFVSAMYSLSFVSSDVNFVVKEALKMIPPQSNFYRCLADVITWHEKYPDDWKQTWFELQKKWTDEVGCPDGVFVPFNIDAKINAAYIALGLLYGRGDYSKTMEITTHAGQDSDCNPSSAGGILGTILGYEKIPAHWKQGLAEAEDVDFKYTTMSLNDVYRLGMKHALQVIVNNGGKVSDETVGIKTQNPQAVRLEQSFENHFPVEKRQLSNELSNEVTLDFDGVGIVVLGDARPVGQSSWDYKGDFAFRIEVTVDKGQAEAVSLPANFLTRRHELFWRYQMPPGKHTVSIKLLNPDRAFALHLSDLIVYRNQLAK